MINPHISPHSHSNIYIYMYILCIYIYKHPLETMVEWLHKMVPWIVVMGIEWYRFSISIICII
jgi:hypothetical protein